MGEGDYGTQSHAAEPYSCLQVYFFSHERFLNKLALLQIKLIGAYKGNYTLSELHYSISAHQRAEILVHYKDGKRLESFSNHIEGRRLRIE